MDHIPASAKDRDVAITREQARRDPRLAAVLEDAAKDFPRAALTVSQAQAGTWNASFHIETEDGDNIVQVSYSAPTPFEAARRALEDQRPYFRLPFHGRTDDEVVEGYTLSGRNHTGP